VPADRRGQGAAAATRLVDVADRFLVLLGALVQQRFHHAPLGAAIAVAVGVLFSGGVLIVRSGLLERRLRVLLAGERAALANLAEREVQLARLNERLVEDSRRDALTGMRNRPMRTTAPDAHATAAAGIRASADVPNSSDAR
jgi:hypothetical protein